METIKTKVENLLHFGFVYHVPLMEWVSNLVPIDKKQGTIHVCINYLDLNVMCPKDNYLTPFTNQIINYYSGCESFSFMDGFSSYNQIAIKPKDQHKKAFVCPWGILSYRKLRFGLNNVGATFRRAKDYAFHNIKHIIQYYLDDLPSHSK